MGFEFAGATDVGRKRDHNEDALLLLPEHNVAVVCDGMGGHAAGEVASGIGVETVKRFFEIAGDPDATWPFRYDRTKDEGTNLLVVAAQWANQRIREASDPGANAPGKRGMGTTFVGCLVRDRKSTRLNSSHLVISYAVFCLKKKNAKIPYIQVRVVECVGFTRWQLVRR